MPLFGKKESSPEPRPSFSQRPSFSPQPPAQPKSALGILKESLLGSSRPAPKPEQKAQQTPGLFGKEGYGSYSQLREQARKSTHKFNITLPSGERVQRQVYEKGRKALIDEMESYAKRFQQQGTLSDETYRTRLLPSVKKEVSRLKNSGQLNKARELEIKIGEWEQLRGGGKK